MMKLEHVAIWTHQLESLKDFYVRYFDAEPNKKYVSEEDFDGRFTSYFLSFFSGARLELMTLDCIPQGDNIRGFESTGLTHIAFSVDTPEELDRIFDRLESDRVPIIGRPRMTGDGYYEACVLDPDGNRVEITVTP
ncbi:VOC family protein [Clostridium sp. D33t1_170424_F3]|uniref:VOC family protein n=1 Tax=Clostridium sp. D33t1_170424_F3 TaxID=2787099 RepID=UPI00257085F2|nr:VOC family protein [Clostridium sp. D33t1_170424_F3]